MQNAALPGDDGIGHPIPQHFASTYAKVQAPRWKRQPPTFHKQLRGDEISSWLRKLGDAQRGAGHGAIGHSASEPQLGGGAASPTAELASPASATASGASRSCRPSTWTSPAARTSPAADDEGPGHAPDSEGAQGQTPPRPPRHAPHRGARAIRERLARFEDRLHVRQSKATTYADVVVRQGVRGPFATHTPASPPPGAEGGGEGVHADLVLLRGGRGDAGSTASGTEGRAHVAAGTAGDAGGGPRSLGRDGSELPGRGAGGTARPRVVEDDRDGAGFFATCPEFAFFEEEHTLTLAGPAERGELRWPYNVPLLNRREEKGTRLAPRAANAYRHSGRKRGAVPSGELPTASGTAGPSKAIGSQPEASPGRAPASGASGSCGTSAWTSPAARPPPARPRTPGGLHIVRDLLDGYAADPLQDCGSRYVFDPFGEGGWERVDGGSSSDFLEGFVGRQEEIDRLLRERAEQEEEERGKPEPAAVVMHPLELVTPCRVRGATTRMRMTF